MDESIIFTFAIYWTRQNQTGVVGSADSGCGIIPVGRSHHPSGVQYCILSHLHSGAISPFTGGGYQT